MLLIEFMSTVVARTDDGDCLIAFMDGIDGKERVCVALMRATPAVARALCVALGSALNEDDGQELTEASQDREVGAGP